MAKAKEEVKDEMRDEMRAREEKKGNFVVYGLKESDDADGKKRKDADEEKVKEMATEMGVAFNGEIKASYRAGAKGDGDRPRPLIVTIENDDTREEIMANARRLAGKEDWKRVFISPDLTWRQREEVKKEEKRLKEEAERKTVEANGEGREGKFIVLGPRRRRWFKWICDV